jgi:DNA-3-methyladenine glycosylase II
MISSAMPEERPEPGTSGPLPADDSCSQPVARIHLPVAAPFNLEATVRLLQRRPTSLIDHWQERHYRRALATSDGVRLVTVVNHGTNGVPDVWLEISGGAVSEGTTRTISGVVRWMLGIDVAPAPAAWLAAVEPRLEVVAMATTGFRAPCFPSLFEACARVIPFQQLSIDAGTAIIGRLVTSFGAPVTCGTRAWVAFPEPEIIAEAHLDRLRETGLSRAKVRSLQAVARLASAGALERERFLPLPTDVALAELRSLPGIGPWSAALILLRGLRRMEVFPPGDVGAARNLAALLGHSGTMAPAEASAYAARLGDRQGYLYFLGLASQLLARGVSLAGQNEERSERDA